jgi:hypothetical protein
MEEKNEIIKNTNINNNNKIKNNNLTNSRNKNKENLNNKLSNFSTTAGIQNNTKEEKFTSINSKILSIESENSIKINNLNYENLINEDNKNIYYNLKQIFINLCDSNGFIYYKDYIQL